MHGAGARLLLRRRAGIAAEVVVLGLVRATHLQQLLPELRLADVVAVAVHDLVGDVVPSEVGHRRRSLPRHLRLCHDLHVGSDPRDLHEFLPARRDVTPNIDAVDHKRSVVDGVVL